MTRPLVFDLTHLRHRLAYESPSGIDRVDLLFAQHYAAGRAAAAAHYGKTSLKVWERAALSDVVSAAQDKWRETAPLATDAVFAQVSAWLTGAPAGRQTVAAAPPRRSLAWHVKTKLMPFVEVMHARRPRPDALPRDALYLNIAQHALEQPRFFDWLRLRPDVRAVFFLHDLLPLDHPEFWWDGHEALFRRRVDTMMAHAAALITSSTSVEARASEERQRRGLPPIPILACPLPSVFDGDATTGPAIPPPALAQVPYFVALGTVEPRKNHLLLLNLWRRLADRGGAVPKLVIVGKRGWENAHTIGMLERSPALPGHVLEVPRLSSSGVEALLRGACALLMPSHAEGYGLPLVEALSLGTPVVASDLPVFREVTQNKALFRDTVDGLGWVAAIDALADRASDTARTARRLAADYRPVSIASYFTRVDAFLGSL